MRKQELARLYRVIGQVKGPAPARLYTDGQGNLCSAAKPAQYSFPARTFIWGQVA